MRQNEGKGGNKIEGEIEEADEEANDCEENDCEDVSYNCPVCPIFLSSFFMGID